MSIIKMKKGLEIEWEEVKDEIPPATPEPEPPNRDDAGYHYYRVRAITDERGTRPDIPEGISWVGNTDGEVYVIKTRADLSGLPDVEELTFEEAARALRQITDLNGDDVGEKWGVS